MTRLFAFIWVTALALAASFILVLLWSPTDTEMNYPQNFTSAIGLNIIFIGSSLTGAALPATEPADGILEDGRSSAIVSVAGISEQFSNKLMADAIDAGAETIFLEINAYAHDYIDFDHAGPAFLYSMERPMRMIGAQLTATVKTLFNLEPKNSRKNKNHVVLLGSMKADGTFDAARLQSDKYYRFVKIKPEYGDELQALLARAKDANVEVIFFSPPRPQSAVNMMGNDEFTELHSHLEYIAGLYDIPLWHSPIPWPDNHFMDIKAHSNVRGRIRFQKELAKWYEARQ